MSVSIEINGLNRLRKMAEKYPAISQSHIDKAIFRSLGEVDRDMRPWIPVDQGALHSNFIIQQAPFRGSIGTKIPYAKSVHDMYSAGTPYKNPSKNKNAVAGFMTVAGQQAEEVINSTFQKAISDIIKEISRL